MVPSRIFQTGAVIAGLAAAATAACASGPTPPAPSPAPPAAAAPVSTLVVQVCQGCHGPEILSQKGRSKDEWATVVDTMVERGAMASDQDLQAIVDFLAKTYPVDPKPAGG